MKKPIFAFLDSPHWVVFADDVIIDAQAGRMWRLRVSVAKEMERLPKLCLNMVKEVFCVNVHVIFS